MINEYEIPKPKANRNPSGGSYNLIDMGKLDIQDRSASDFNLHPNDVKHEDNIDNSSS